MQAITSKAELLKELAQGAFVITPNNRLSACLTEDYFHQAQAETVDKPDCMPFLSFIHLLYQNLQLSNTSLSHPLLLNANQSRHLWQKILKNQSNLTFSKGLLTSVMDAWSRLVQWQIPADDTAFNHSPQCQQFQQWWQQFDQQLDDLNALCEEQLIDYLITNNSPLINQNLIWACFDDFTPQQQQLQKHLSKQGITQYSYDIEQRASNTYQFAAKDHDDEFKQLILWLRHRLDAGDDKIGVVIPDLQQRARSLQRQLKRYLSPELYNLSLGQSLNDYPLIAHAISWLSLDKKQLNHEQARLLLHSPYIKGSKEELQQRAQFIQDSPLLQEKSQPLSQWLKHLTPKTPILANCLKELSEYPETASPQQWVELFYQRLENLGFPGDYGLDSENYQCFHRFTELFNSFRQLGFISKELSIFEAITILNDLAQQSIFQPQTISKKPIQISGLLEASGCEFDSLWVMGLTDQCLPQKTKLSSFIPHQFQRDHNMPHSTPERELQFSQKIIHRFTLASGCSIFSYPQMSGDTPNLVSPLISSMEKHTPIADQGLEQNSAVLVKLEDDYIIPLLPDEKISGGTALLANQAKCPFRAFAAHRLYAKAAKGLTEGFDQLERGQIVHKVMEIIWGKLGNQAQLLALDTKALDDCIESAIATALSPFLMNKSHAYPELLHDIELTRLKRVVHRCLDWEKERPAFEIDALEQDYVIQLQDLEFKVRVDRLDKVDNDKKWVIDYKSTIPTSSPWKDERPREPQLLLYALLDNTINTLMFIQLKAGQLESKSFSEDDLKIKGNSTLKKDERWEDYRQHWQQQLELLAKEFSQGYCPPQPLNQSICEQCDFQSLCRFNQGNQ